MVKSRSRIIIIIRGFKKKSFQLGIWQIPILSPELEKHKI